MSFFKIFDVAGSAMSAQSVRLNATASNLANADVVASSAEEAYKSKQPVFASMLEQATLAGGTGQEPAAMVRVTGILESEAPPAQEYAPNHPLANDQGYIFRSNVNTVEEMANMMSASRSYQNSVEVMNTAKQLLVATIRLGQE